MDERRLARLRWRCRRGMLENDLLLARFLDRRGADLSEQEVAALDHMLDMADNELWELLCGRREAMDDEVRAMVSALAREIGNQPG